MLLFIIRLKFYLLFLSIRCVENLTKLKQENVETKEFFKLGFPSK